MIDPLAGYVRFRVALNLAVGLKSAAFLVVLGGTVLIADGFASIEEDVHEYVITVGVVTLAAAGILAFGGYLLELVVALYDEVRSEPPE